MTAALVQRMADPRRTQNPWHALWAMMVGFFMILLDATIVAVANPEIMEHLDTDYNGVLWVTSACEDEPFRPGEPFWTLDYRTIPALARSRDAVHVFDLNHLLCTSRGANPDFGGVADIRPDGAHFTDAGALAIAQWLMPIVLGDTPAPTRVFPRSRDAAATAGPPAPVRRQPSARSSGSAPG